jgi:hypothetical protein
MMIGMWTANFRGAQAASFRVPDKYPANSVTPSSSTTGGSETAAVLGIVDSGNKIDCAAVGRAGLDIDNNHLR